MNTTHNRPTTCADAEAIVMSNDGCASVAMVSVELWAAHNVEDHIDKDTSDNRCVAASTALAQHLRHPPAAEHTASMRTPTD